MTCHRKNLGQALYAMFAAATGLWAGMLFRLLLVTWCIVAYAMMNW